MFGAFGRGVGYVIGKLRSLWNRIFGVAKALGGKVEASIPPTKYTGSGQIGTGTIGGGGQSPSSLGGFDSGGGSYGGGGQGPSGGSPSSPPDEDSGDLTARAAKIHPVDKTRELIEEALRIGFLTSTNPMTGVKWKPLKWRVGMPLILTGLMMSKVLQSAREATIDERGVVLVLPFPPYSKYHQFGTERIPARPFYGISDELKEKIATEYQHRIFQFLITG